MNFHNILINELNLNELARNFASTQGYFKYFHLKYMSDISRKHL